MDAWNTIVSFLDGLFSGAMLASGSVHIEDEIPGLDQDLFVSGTTWRMGPQNLFVSG